MRKIKMIGRRFGRLKVLEQTSNVGRRRAFLCRCLCGVKKVVVGESLRAGEVRSCGCLRAELIKEWNVTHGHTRNKKVSGTYTSYRKMLERCLDKNADNFKYYGGRGVVVCSRWRSSFRNFLIDMGERPLGLTLERRNNNKGYSPKNCAWETRFVQANNKRPRGSTP